MWLHPSERPSWQPPISIGFASSARPNCRLKLDQAALHPPRRPKNFAVPVLRTAPSFATDLQLKIWESTFAERRPESTLSGRCGSRRWTLQLGGKLPVAKNEQGVGADHSDAPGRILRSSRPAKSAFPRKVYLDQPSISVRPKRRNSKEPKPR